MLMISWKKAFSLIEVLVSILVFSMIIIAWFYAFSAISIWKIKIIWDTDIEKESYFFSEKLFQEIKNGWTIDYEEYFNRKVVNSTWTNLYQSGHYFKNTWFWNYGMNWDIWTDNYWNWFYYCRSYSTDIFLKDNWCWNDERLNSPDWLIWNNWINYSWIPQRYLQHKLQYVDYNESKNENWWDINGDWRIVWDADDNNVRNWPEAFSSSWEVQELYLIWWNKKNRTLFRWKVIEDPNKPDWATCDFWNGKNPTWSGCLWTIEFLKLVWKDRWINHDKLSTWAYDWIIDTWIIDPNFAWNQDIIAWTNNDYRVSLFSNWINVKDVKFFIYPNKDFSLEILDGLFDISPYLRIKYTITASRDKRKWIKWKIPELDFTSTINLSDLFSKK